MPKLKFSLPGDERFNTLLSIVALLQRQGEMHIDEIAEHFHLTRQAIRAMLGTINTTSFMPRNSEEQLPFFIDLERVDEEDGIVCLEFDNAPKGLPRITTQQGVALLAGLHFLRSLPDFEESEDIDELISLLKSDQGTVQTIDIQNNHFDSDLAVLKKAIISNRRIECRYVNSKGQESVRQIDPLILVNSEEHWYLRGFCLGNQEVRTFRLDHMVDARILDTARGEDAIRAASELDETEPIYMASNTDIEVVLELAPEAYALAGYFKQVTEPWKAGEESITARIKIGYLPDLGPMVSRFGGHAKVISPPEARDAVRRYAQQALANLDSKFVVD